MTHDEIRSAIQADPALQALVPDTTALAAALSVGRTRVVRKLGGVGVVMEALGPDVGATVLDGLDALKATNSAVKWAWVLINRGELDFGSTATRAMITALLDEPVRSALLAIAEEPEAVSEFDVRVAIFNNDGSLRV